MNIRTICSLVLGSVFLVAAAAKSWDGAEVLRLIAAMLPKLFMDWITPRELLLVLVFAEAAVVASVIVASRSAAALATAGIALLLFSSLLVWMRFKPSRPACGCFGPFGGDGARGIEIGVLRNMCLLSVVGWLLVTRKDDKHSHARNARPAVNHVDSRGAFSLIEVLISLAVIAILVSLALPALAQSRYKARETRSLAIQRELCQSLVAYGADHRDSFPYMAATPGDPFSEIVVNGFRLPHPEGYFRNQAWHWASLVLPKYFDAPRDAIESRETHRVLRDVLHYPETVIRSHYFVSYTIFAAPEYWRDGATTDLGFLRATRWTEVAFPSQKGLTLDVSIGALANDMLARDRCYSGLADGSARIFSFSGVDPTRVSYPALIPGSRPVMSTTNGLRGIDF